MYCSRSRSSATRCSWYSPSSSMTTFSSRQTKSTMYQSIECCLRNFRPSSRLPRMALQSEFSASVERRLSFLSLLRKFIGLAVYSLHIGFLRYNPLLDRLALRPLTLALSPEYRGEGTDTRCVSINPLHHNQSLAPQSIPSTINPITINPSNQSNQIPLPPKSHYTQVQHYHPSPTLPPKSKTSTKVKHLHHKLNR